MKLFSKESEEVYYSNDDISYFSNEEIDYLKQVANQNPRKRVRLCTHRNKSDSLHEMFIVHMRDCYVPPHKHLGKAESMSILEGEVDVVLFEEDGRIKNVIHMGDQASGKIFYQRISEPTYHSLIIRTEYLVFHEITEGPFIREKTIFAPWAPKENSDQVKIFTEGIEMKINQARNHE